MVAAFATAGSKSDGWKRRSRSPSVVVPSGKSPMQSPSASASCTLPRMRAMSRRRSRFTKSVPARSAIQPATGKSRISLFAMKRAGRTPITTKVSTHETWFAAIIAASPCARGSGPETRRRIPRMRTSFPDHQRTRRRRVGGAARGKTNARISAAEAAWPASRSQRTSRVARLARGEARSVRDAHAATPAAEDADAVARTEFLRGRLHDRDVAARVEEHRDLVTRALVRGMLDVGADDAAEERAAEGAHDLAASAAHVAAGDPARDRARRGAQARVARADVHRAHGIDDAEAHRPLARHLVAAVIRGAVGIGASAQDERAERRCRPHP